jgi:type IV pilus assembly protein PilE
MKQAKGFTLIELMITVVILAIIMSVGLPAYTGYVTKGKLTEASANLSSLRVQLEQFFQDNRTYQGVGGCGIGMPVPPAVKYFTYTCASLTTTTYTITATGVAGSSADGFTYTVDQANSKSTTVIAPATNSGWKSPTPNSCWVTDKGGIC